MEMAGSVGLPELVEMEELARLREVFYERFSERG